MACHTLSLKRGAAKLTAEKAICSIGKELNALTLVNESVIVYDLAGSRAATLLNSMGAAGSLRALFLSLQVCSPWA